MTDPDPSLALPIDLIHRLEAHFDEMIEMQRKKLLVLARRSYPNFTEEDLFQPHDYPKLLQNPHFNFEDGLLAGLLQSQMSLRAGFYRSPEA